MDRMFQADRERQEAEEMKKEMGLGEQDDSLVKMLQVSPVQTCLRKREWTYFNSSNGKRSVLFSNGRSPERTILTVSCLTWKPSTPRAAAKPREGRSSDAD